MNWLEDLSKNRQLQSRLNDFLRSYGLPGLEQAINHYSNRQQEYICKTQDSIVKIMISDIYYLEIHGHNILVHTEKSVYRKYGSLNKELGDLSHYGFIKCNKSCIVSLEKINQILNDNIILKNNVRIHMSRTYAPKVLTAFTLTGR